MQPRAAARATRVGGRWVPVIALACAATFAPSVVFSDGWNAEEARARWAREVLRRGLDPATIPYPLDFTEEMQALARKVTGNGGSTDRLRLLQQHIFDEDRFPFDYESRETFSAVDAFEHRSGNCVSFTNLFIAMGRSLGIPVLAALPTVRADAEQEGRLIVVNNHIVAIYKQNPGWEVYDFSHRREHQQVGLRPIDDIVVTAIFLNNLGAEALIRGDAAGARHDLEAAVKLAPGFASAYGNLGIVRRQLGDVDGALDAYRLALELEPGYPTILNNLAALYQSEGMEESAQAALLAASLRDATPYMLIIRGDFELNQRRYGSAFKMFRRAARLAPKIPEPQLAIARAHHARGRLGPAIRAAQRAVELAPDHAGAKRYLEFLEQERGKR